MAYSVKGKMTLMKHFLLSAMFLPLCSFAQLTPEVTSWIINAGETGYNGIESNVQSVQYSAANVYISATCIPGYDIGPWAGNPNTPANQNFVYKLTRTPVQNTGTLTQTALGHIGVWTNGVSVFNAKDGMSYNNAGVWNRNALYYEGSSFDDCLGHPAPNGEYHHHVNPTCLYDDTDSLNHSPIIGFAFDGYPIYGAYAYTNTDGTGAIKRMRSSYVLSSATTRTNGPAVNSTYPAGCYIEDYIFTQGAGDLDVHNGRFCITPDYPNGTYCYFVTLDNTLYPEYPFVIGPTYYGTVPSGNTGPNGGHNTISESVTTYTGSASVAELEEGFEFLVYPNPAEAEVAIYVDALAQNDFTLELTDILGNELLTMNYIQTAVSYSIDVSDLAAGTYFMTLKKGAVKSTQTFVKK